MITQFYAAQPSHSICALCAVVPASRSCWYAAPAARAQVCQDLDLRGAIEQVVLAFPGYGHRRVACALQRPGWVVNHKRELRAMR